MKTVKPPPTSYLQNQDLLRDGKANQEVKKDLIRTFQATFALKESHATITYRLQDALQRKFDNHVLMDHVIWFTDRYKMCQVAVTQPYNTVEAITALEPSLNQLGITLVDLNSWVWHYPGHTTCWGLIVPRASFKLVQLRPDTHDYASEIFNQENRLVSCLVHF